MKKSFENYERKRDRLSEICFIEKESEIVKRIARKDKKGERIFCIVYGKEWNEMEIYFKPKATHSRTQFFSLRKTNGFRDSETNFKSNTYSKDLNNLILLV